MTRVLIAHSYPAIRAGLRGALVRAQGIEVVAAASRGEEALRLILQLEPAVALVACSLAGTVDGVAVAEQAKRVRVLALSEPGDDDLMARAQRWWEAVGCKMEALTKREWQVMVLMADGLSNCEIADRLRLSKHTVHAHVKSILSKLDLQTRQQAIVLYLKRGDAGSRRQIAHLGDVKRLEVG